MIKNKLVFAGYCFKDYQANNAKDMVAINFRRTKRMIDCNKIRKNKYYYKVYIQKEER